MRCQKLIDLEKGETEEKSGNDSKGEISDEMTLLILQSKTMYQVVPLGVNTY